MSKDGRSPIYVNSTVDVRYRRYFSEKTFLRKVYVTLKDGLLDVKGLWCNF